MNYHTITNPDDDYIWNLMLTHVGETFYTARGLPFTYHQKISRTGEPLGELIIDRKEKTITRNTVLLAYEKALELRPLTNEIVRKMAKFQNMNSGLSGLGTVH